jgi:multicomponent K+:H+ antiporter subunit G
MSLLEIIISVLLLTGAMFRLFASIGIFHFSDFYLRAHSAAKAGTLPPALLVLSVALFFGDPLLTIKLTVLMVLYFFSSPTGIQIINRGAHVAKVPMSPQTWIDELAEAHLTDVEYLIATAKDKQSKETHSADITEDAIIEDAP